MTILKIVSKLSVSLITNFGDWTIAYVDGRQVWGEGGARSVVIGPLAVHFN